MNWLLIGASASVLEYLPRARNENRIDRTITCNAGIELEPRPDVYVLVDQISMRRHNDAARMAQRNGTRLVTLNRVPEAQRNRDCHWYDEFIATGPGQSPPTRERWGGFRYSGPLCVEYAIRNGAKTVVLVGCDGYTGKNDYFDGWTSRKYGELQYVYQRMTVEVLQPAFQSICRVWPEVQFLQYGDPCYAIQGENWRVIGKGLGSLAEDVA